MKNILLFLTIILLMLGCATTQKVPSGKYLLRRNSVVLNYSDSMKKSNKTVSSLELENYIPNIQTPNKRVLGIPLYLTAYNLIDSSKGNWFQNIFRKIGEAPVVYDSTQTELSKNDMISFLQNKGFYSASIIDTVVFKKKKARVTYEAESGLPTIISSVKYDFIDTTLEQKVLADTSNSFVKVGIPLNKYDLNQERSRISENLENMGYYNFSVNNIHFIVDTLDKVREADVTIEVSSSYNFTGNNSSTYRIRNIYLNGEYSSTEHKTTIYDTTKYDNIYILTKQGQKPNIKPKTLVDLIPIKPNSVYSKQETSLINTNLSNLRFFKNINVLFNEIRVPRNENISLATNNSDSTSTNYYERYIDCNIQCMPTKRQSTKLNGELSSNANYTGISVTLGYANKNLFRGAELFDIGITTAYDIMHTNEKSNSFEYGISTSLTLPKLVVPFKVNRSEKNKSLQTRIELSYDYQDRAYYRRTLSNAAFGYQWERKQSSFIFKPLNVSYIQVPWIDEDFWESIENKYLQTSYTSQLIFGMAGSYIHTNSHLNKHLAKTLKINIETSGNFLNLMTNIFETPYTIDDSDKYKTIFGVRYSQYVKADFNYTLNQKINNNGALVFRAYAGGGYAYNNTYTLPFDKMFFVGGASSMRGWQVRTLGPGSTPPVDSDYPEQVGNIRLETNLEGRFHVYGPLNGALFLDCGNIWSNYKGQDENDVSKLRFDTFLQQLALNTGIGARFDFDFFILRLDWGVILRNPGWDAGERWIRAFKFENTALHFGIGYPF